MVHAYALLEHADEPEIGADLGAQEVLDQPDVRRHVFHLGQAPRRLPGHLPDRADGVRHRNARAYYSAAFALVRQRLWLRATETTVQLFRDHEIIATHPRRFQPGNRSTIDEHLPPPRASCWQAVSPKLGHVHHHGERRHGAVGDAGAVAHGCEPVPDGFGGDGVHGQMTEGGEDVLADNPDVGLPRPGLPVPGLTVEELGGEGIHRAPRRAGAAVVPDHFGEGGDEPAGLGLI